jgi:hypothetical protein
MEEVFTALSDRERQRILFALLTDGSVDLSPMEPDGGEHEPRTVNLYHNHLPRLVDYGLVEWDREADRVSRGPAFGEAEPVLRALREAEVEISEPGR